MSVSSTGKTPELFDITVLSDGADNVNYINNAPETKIVGSNTTCVSKRLFLSSETLDDAFCTQLDFKWSCDNENVIISLTLHSSLIRRENMWFLLRFPTAIPKRLLAKQ